MRKPKGAPAPSALSLGRLIGRGLLFVVYFIRAFLRTRPAIPHTYSPARS